MKLLKAPLLLLFLPLFLIGCQSSTPYTDQYEEAQRAMFEGDYVRGGKILVSLEEEWGDHSDILSLSLEHALITYDYMKAVSLIDRLLAADPESWYAHSLTKARILEETGNAGGALKVYRQLCERDPYSLSIGLDLIRILTEEHEREEAYTVAELLYTFHPDAKEVLKLLVELSPADADGWQDVLEYETASP